MSKKIYKLFMSRMSEATYRLSQEEYEALMTKVSEALKQVGGKSILIGDSSWSSEEWQFFGVEEFPDIEAVQKHTELLNELNWLRYVESFSLLGTEYNE
jgi:uncharacterized protein (DUF1330 family)